ncbi:hypothetical protein COV11_03930 [Candidatus Woesearchaeota archaeon CG10_big_fil_rev_8_21_14_0_10_30_7]|nr:MAG: hypothetical protein COV11_03930 [Candidatus Woesearchaeota archaeon CG10_big_fil_rev_8_21_14_0_10_30_7]
MIVKKICFECEEDHPKIIPFEYSKITANIFIGTNMCCQGHFKKELLVKGIKADLSLEENKMDTPWGVEMFLWLPVKDHNPPSKEQVFAGVNFLKTCVKNQKKVYVHCARGHTRAPTMVIAYLVSKGMNLEKALSFVKKKRPVIHPTKAQLSFLKKFEKVARNVK